MLPGALAYVSKLIVDAIVLASETGQDADKTRVYQFIILEVGIFAALAAVQRGLAVCQSLLRAMLGHRVNVIILEKAIELDLPQFEDAEFYDSMNRARRGASSRPLGAHQQDLRPDSEWYFLTDLRRSLASVLSLGRAHPFLGCVASILCRDTVFWRSISLI